MSTEMFDKYNNIPEGYVPNNRPQPKECQEDIIIRGGTCEHIFVLPITLTAQDDIVVTYTQSISKIITRVPNSYYSLDTESGDIPQTVIRIVLSDEETLKFKAICNEPAKAQISITFASNETKSFSDIKSFRVIQTLENI